MTTWTARLARHVCQCYPFFSGCGTLANRPLLRRLTPAGAVVTTTLRDGSHIRVRPGDYIGRALYFFGDFDPKQTYAWVQQYFGGIPAQPQPPKADISEPLPGRKRLMTGNADREFAGLEQALIDA